MQKDFTSDYDFHFGGSPTTIADGDLFPSSPMIHQPHSSPMTPSPHHQHHSWGMNSEFGILLTPFDEHFLGDSLYNGSGTAFAEHQQSILEDGFSELSSLLESDFSFSQPFHQPSINYQLNNNDAGSISATINRTNGSDLHRPSISPLPGNGMFTLQHEGQITHSNIDFSPDRSIVPISLLDDSGSFLQEDHSTQSLSSVSPSLSDYLNDSTIWDNTNQDKLSLVDITTASSNDVRFAADSSFESSVDTSQPSGAPVAASSSWCSSSSKKHRDGSSRTSTRYSSRSSQYYGSPSHCKKSGSSSRKKSSGDVGDRRPDSNEYSSSGRRYHRHQSSSRHSPSRIAISTPNLRGSASHVTTPERRQGLLVSGGSLNHSACALRGAGFDYSTRPFYNMSATSYYNPVNITLGGSPNTRFPILCAPPPLSPSGSQYVTRSVNTQGLTDADCAVTGDSTVNSFGSCYTPLTPASQYQSGGETSSTIAMASQRLGYAATSPPSDGTRVTKKLRVSPSTEWSTFIESHVAERQQQHLKDDFALQHPPWKSLPLHTMSELVPYPPAASSSSSAISSSGPPSLIRHSATSGAASEIGSSPPSPNPVDFDDDDVVFERCVAAVSQQSSVQQIQSSNQGTSNGAHLGSQTQQTSLQRHQATPLTCHTTTWGNPIVYPLQTVTQTDQNSVPGTNNIPVVHQPYVVIGQCPSSTDCLKPACSTLTSSSSCSKSQAIETSTRVPPVVTSTIVKSTPATHNIHSQPPPISHSSAVVQDSIQLPRPVAISVGVDISQSPQPASQIPYPSLLPVSYCSLALPKPSVPPIVASSPSHVLASLHLVPLPPPPPRSFPAALQLITPSQYGATQSELHDTENSRNQQRPTPSVVQSSAPSECQQPPVNSRPSVPPVAQGSPSSVSTTPESPANSERSKRKRSLSKVRVKAKTEPSLKRSKTNGQYKPSERKKGTNHCGPSKTGQDAQDEKGEISSNNSEEDSVDDSVTEVLATSLISVFDSIFAEEHKIKRKQLVILVSRFLPTAISSGGSESEEIKTELQVQSSLLNRLLGTALDVYSGSWSELVRSQVENVKMMTASISGITSALLQCTSSLCAALDHFISDWIFQLRLQTEILSIPESKKAVFSSLVEHFLKLDLSSRREYRVQTIETLFKTLPMIIERQNQLIKGKQEGNQTFILEDSSQHRDSSRCETSDSAICHIPPPEQHDDTDRRECHPTILNSSISTDDSSFISSTLSQTGSDLGDGFHGTLPHRTELAFSTQAVDLSSPDLDVSNPSDPEAKIDPKRPQGHSVSDVVGEQLCLIPFELSNEEHEQHERMTQDTSASASGIYTDSFADPICKQTEQLLCDDDEFGLLQ